MGRRFSIAIVSDIHYAGAAEQAVGNDFEYRGLKNPLKRYLVKAYRHFIWLRQPLKHNAQLDKFIAQAGSPDWVIANGDYSCDTGFIGLSHDASLASARECLGKLRERFAPNFRATLGDHEFGKLSFVGRQGGMRLKGFQRAVNDLNLPPFWKLELGNYVLLGVTSSLITLPLLEPDLLPEELAEWRRLATEHLEQIRAAFQALEPRQKVLLFCHDPSALPFLWRDEIVRAKLGQIEQTIIGHLHTNLVFRASQWLSGMPVIRRFGHTTLRLSSALSEARLWRPFKVRLCPSPAGIQLLKDGGFYTLELEESATEPAKFQFHRLKW